MPRSEQVESVLPIQNTDGFSRAPAVVPASANESKLWQLVNEILQLPEQRLL